MRKCTWLRTKRLTALAECRRHATAHTCIQAVRASTKTRVLTLAALRPRHCPPRAGRECGAGGAHRNARILVRHPHPKIRNSSAAARKTWSSRNLHAKQMLLERTDWAGGWGLHTLTPPGHIGSRREILKR